MSTEQSEKIRVKCEENNKLIATVAPNHYVPPQPKRILCEQNHKLIATMTEQGISIWCLYERKSHVITWNEINTYREAWSKGESVVHHGDQEAC
jgi:hypothetical protein